MGVKTTFTAGTYKPVVVVTIIEGSHPAVVTRCPTVLPLDHLQGVFFNWPAPFKVSDYIKKSSKCQNFLRVWHLVIFREDQ